jgi:predicted permease
MSLWDRLLRSRRVTREVRDELRAHLGERVDDLVEDGVPEAEAHRRARVELGNAARAIEDSRGVWASRVLDRLARDLRWTWRGLRARRGRAVLAGVLLALAVSANVLVFVAVDALVFDRNPYPNVRQLVTFDRWLVAADLAEWRRQPDLFASVEGWFSGTTFLLGADRAEHLSLVNVTPGLFESLGVRPSWGRALTRDDGARMDEQAVLVSAALARRRFGSPEASLNQLIPTAAAPLRVVGVMPPDFSFPSNGSDIWRVLDPAGPLMRNRAGLSGIARVQDGMSFSTLAQAVTQRSPAVAAATGVAKDIVYKVQPYGLVRGGRDQLRMFYVLLGAALCLLLTACVNVLNLELTVVLGRVRTFAVQSALGASRGTLIRVAVLEGLVLVGASGLAAWLLATLTLPALGAALPEPLRLSTSKTLALDGRAMVYMLVMAIAIWVIAALPPVIYASRLDLSKPLKIDDRSTSPRRVGTLVRRVVTIAQVALAVLLVIVGGLYVRTYSSLLAQPKGFDSTNLASVSMALPMRFYPSAVSRQQLADAIVERLLAQPGVVDAIDGPTPPSIGNSPTVGVRMVIDDQVRDAGTGRTFGLAVTEIDPRYLQFLHVPLVAGRWLAPGDDPTAAVVSDRVATRFWPSVDAAIGGTFDAVDQSGGRTRMWGPGAHRVLGVFADYRTRDRDGPYASRAPWEEIDAFVARQPPAPPPTVGPGELDTGGSYGIVGVLARLDSHERANAVLAAVRGIDPRLTTSIEFVDDVYAEQYRTTLLATRIVGGFAVTSFLIAMAGLYGVMAFLVAGRTREIGIRMALGADRTRIGRFVMGSSLRLVFAGAAIGIVAAVLVSRTIASQLFGVTPTDPATYVIVAIVTIITALLATWQPARRAARVDPVQTLRAE